MAHRGTLFLDEISEPDMSLQSKLLQLLQDGQFCRIGAQEDKKVEVRVVCATNRKLEEEIAENTLSADLFIASMWSICTCRRCAIASPICPDPVFDHFLECYNRKFN